MLYYYSIARYTYEKYNPTIFPERVSMDTVSFSQMTTKQARIV